jgi:hypothetical protein
MSFANHHITVTRPADTDGLGRSTGSSEEIYDGRADVQEKAVQSATQGGQTVRIGDGMVFLPVTVEVQPGDEVTVTRTDDSTFEATIAEVTRLDDSFVLTKDR